MPSLAQFDVLSLLANPRVFAVGAAAATLPILIHLLNRRRFKVVDWAAMEFLLAANQQNRRRLKIEDLALLALRCLALLLIGATLARPFMPNSAPLPFLPAQRHELVVLLDDSLSMRARAGNESAWDSALRAAQNLISSLAALGGNHSLTLLLASQPERPIILDESLTSESVTSLSDRLTRLTCTNRRLELAAVLKSLADRGDSQRKNHHERFYFLTDLREIDWQLATQDASPTVSGIARSLARIASASQACTVLDAAAPAPLATADQLASDQNLSLVAVHSVGLLLAGVPATIEVSVKNQGSQPAHGIRLSRLLPGSLPTDLLIAELAPQQTKQVRFPLFVDSSDASPTAAEIVPQQATFAITSADQGFPDRLAEDDVIFFPVHWSNHVSVLLVDGDSGDREEEAESYYLQRALDPSGPAASGLRTSVAHSADVAGLDLSDFQVIFLLNCDQLGDSPWDFVSRLQTWVRRGGGLVMMPGDRIDPRIFNEIFWRDGQGLSPLRLASKRGDPDHANWFQLQVPDANHHLLGHYSGRDNPLFSGLKIFEWWEPMEPSRSQDVASQVACQLTNPQRSPFLTERSFGQGKVVLFAVPADSAWTNWPGDPSYLLVMQDLVRSLAAGQTALRQVAVGQPLVEDIDISHVQLQGELTGPGELQLSLTAEKPDSPSSGTPDPRWQLRSPPLELPGFYSLTLTSRAGTPVPRLFAANVSPEEGDLRRTDSGKLLPELTSVGVRLANVADPAATDISGQQREISQFVLWFAVAALAGEQLLGWWWGRRRT